jgi:hypothetical protein
VQKLADHGLIDALIHEHPHADHEEKRAKQLCYEARTFHETLPTEPLEEPPLKYGLPVSCVISA